MPYLGLFNINNHVNMMVADGWGPNKYQAICNHQVDLHGSVSVQFIYLGHHWYSYHRHTINISPKLNHRQQVIIDHKFDPHESLLGHLGALICDVTNCIWSIDALPPLVPGHQQHSQPCKLYRTVAGPLETDSCANFVISDIIGHCHQLRVVLMKNCSHGRLL